MRKWNIFFLCLSLICFCVAVYGIFAYENDQMIQSVEYRSSDLRCYWNGIFYYLMRVEEQTGIQLY